MHILSKSKYIRGLQCERALWLDVNRPSLARYTREQMRRFDAGREFEYAFKATFHDGIDIGAKLKRDVDAYPNLTAQLLDKGEEMALFEAGFLHDDVLVLADVVRQREDGLLDVYEVKSGSVLNETYKRDAAVQYYVISNIRKVNSFNIVYNGADKVDGQFVTVDLTEELADCQDEVAANIAAMKEILAHGEPDTPTGRHCLEPYACPYRHYCMLGIRQLSLF